MSADRRSLAVGHEEYQELLAGFVEAWVATTFRRPARDRQTMATVERQNVMLSDRFLPLRRRQPQTYCPVS